MSAVPKVRFPEFDGDFKTKLLEEIADVYQPKTISQSDLIPNGEYVVYGANGVIGRYSDFNHEAEQVAITCRGNTCGRVNFTPAKAWITGNAMVLNMDANPEVSKKFIYYLSTATDWTYQIAGSGQPQITGTIKKHKFQLPSLPEQQKIASFLSSVDKKIDLLRQKKDALELYKKGLMQKIFSQEIRFKQDDGSDFPDWEEVYADEILKTVSNRNHDGAEQIVSISQNGGAVYRDQNGIDIIASEESVKNYKVIEPGDFVISLRSFQGGIEYSEIRGICSPAYTVMKPKVEFDAEFFRSFFKTGNFIRRLSLTVVGIRDGKQISFGAFSTVPLPFPSLAEQKKIASFLSAIDIKIQNTSSQIEQMETFKKGLLQQMFV